MMDGNSIIILNILYLLRQRPQTFEELWQSGYFRSRKDVRRGLLTLLRAGCIEKYGTKKFSVYVILGYGLNILSLYPNWTPMPVEILEIVKPLGER